LPVAAARALKRNDRVGLIAPGTRPESPAVLSYASKVIEEMGLVPVFGKNILKYQGHLAGSDEERLADLNGFIQDQSIAAIFCVTGGFGALPLLPHIDFATIKSSRKLIVGSDENTVLLLSVLKQCSLRSVLGPNLDRVRSKTSFESLRSAVTSKNTSRIECFSQNLGEISIAKSYSSYSGSASGQLVGGNLSALLSLMGTPYQTDLTDSILYLDDYNERFDILDRWFSNLWVAGALAQVAGVAFGDFSTCGSRGNTNILSLEDLFGERLKELRRPNLFGLNIGHNQSSHSLPIGVNATLNIATATLELHDAAVD